MPSPNTKYHFDEGREVGQRAQKEFPGGTFIDVNYWDYNTALALTEEAIKNGALTIFEAAFAYENFFARIDILHRGTKFSPWQIIEVKKTTSVKDVHIPDVAIQSWIARNSGIIVETEWLMFLNNRSVAPHLEELFLKENVSEQVRKLTPALEKQLRELSQMAKKGEEPKVDIGPHCSEPYQCPFKRHCWSHVQVPSAFDLPRIGKKAWEFYELGREDIHLIDETELNSKQKRALDVHKTGKRFVDKKAISKAMKNWSWPIYFLDFETINPAIPIFDGTHPYEQVPFQFSCHVLMDSKTELKHFEYLQKDSNDPREPIAEALINGIGPVGSVVAYNKKFEEGVLKRLAERFPSRREQLLGIASRLVDPWPIIESAVYDKNFFGSFSLKSVAPALLGPAINYSTMAISDGSQASTSFMALIKNKLHPKARALLIEAMLDYCRQDTLATVELVNWLFKEAA
ncbi:MAG: DUF2779 domain-containing protein [Oligoflexia bacterium]|nr:DUF2779 domain-containing protein [Oligoflexia bacterium]